MSLEISPTLFEIKSDVDGRKVLDHQTKLIPVAHSVAGGPVDVAFPNPQKGTFQLVNSGPGWSTQVWALTVIGPGTVNGDAQEGSVLLDTLPAGVSPNLMIANLMTARVSNPDETKLGPFFKAVPESVWMPIRSGLRLEYNAFIRRIVWLSIESGQLLLRWKQSVSNYLAATHDPNKSGWFPDYELSLKTPPGYKLGENYNQNSSSFVPRPQSVVDAMNAVNFASTWRFYYNVQLLRA